MKQDMNTRDGYKKGWNGVASVGRKGSAAWLLLMMLFVGVSGMKAQTDYSGVYYIASNGYNAGTPTSNYYLCPTEGWCYYDYTTQDDFTSEDNGKPFLTTHKCRDGVYNVNEKAVWIVEKHSTQNYYYIKRAYDGKYIVFNGQIRTTTNADRMRVHLEAMNTPNDNALFAITQNGTAYNIQAKADANAKYWTVNGGNKDALTGQSGKTAGPTGYETTAGIIGIYQTIDGNSNFYLEKATVDNPTITNNFDGTFTITAATGATIYYTIDGTTPTTSTTTTGTTSVNVTQTGSMTVIKAIAKGASDAFASGVTTYNIPSCTKPVITLSGGNVTITCAIEGATIYYTTNGTAATASSTVYTGPFVKGSATTVRAVATRAGYVVSSEVSLLPPAEVSTSDQITDMSGNYVLASNFSSSGSIGTAEHPFRGTIDGNLIPHTLNVPLVAYADGAIIKNVILDNVAISGGTNVGAICNEATGDTRIYNCGVLASNSTATTNNKGYTEISSCSSTISGSGYVGGIVGLLDGSSRVINCFSYANITGGDLVGGIVGKNNVGTTSTNLQTMVMNCMFYGDITGGSSKAPIYNGQIITNRSDQNGVSNFNYFREEAAYVKNINVYNCALSAETRFLQRFEFYRLLLNSQRELAAWWATGSRENKDEMMKWVLEPSQIGTATPYPILKPVYDSNNNIVKYPSVVNYAPDETAYDGTTENCNKGQKLTSVGSQGKLSVTILGGTGGPTGANISNPSLTLTITDKDPDHFNFNYGKVQLPYYNDVGTGNYTQNKVVTGWEVTVSGGTNNFSSSSSDATANVDADGDITLTTPYNFADRKSAQKDDYGASGRIFSQGAYYDVPEGVTSITIRPRWAKCVYVADEYLDVVYNKDMNTPANVTSVGDGKRFPDNQFTKDGSTQTVYTSMSAAVSALNPLGSVYDNAVVLVGNVHSLDVSNKASGKPFTIMSIDLDEDDEPDYSYILRFNSRQRVHPVRVDFINIPGLGMAQKSTGGSGTYNLGIMQPYGWFESTNTALFRVTQFEYDYAGENGANPRAESPMILQGGVIEQWVTAGASETKYKAANSVTYYHVGGNVWFKEFHLGVHQDKTQDEFVTPHPPISVTGGDFEEFYLTGLYNTPNANYPDNAECYINGGHFGKVAGTGMQGIGKTEGADDTGNIVWQIDHADIDEFYAGGINAAHIAEGNITTVISNSRVDMFCGGPKFGDMNSGKKVVTNATDCTFRAFFGAGYGGNSYNREYPKNKYDNYNYDWNTWLATVYKNDYKSDFKGVATRIDYQFIPKSDNVQNVARLFVDYVSFSLATTRDVTSKLTGCTITKGELGHLDLFSQCLGNFYGGGSLGKVNGPVRSTLVNCTVEGNVFGAGYSATLPSVFVMNNAFQTEPYYDGNLGAYLDAEMPATVPYKWAHKDNISSTADAIDDTNHILYTTADLESLGTVTGLVTLTIDGSTTIVGESIYGGGEESAVDGDTRVTVNGCTVGAGSTGKFGYRWGNVYGGGKGKITIQNDGSSILEIEDLADLDAGIVKGNTKVTINGTKETTKILHNVYGGGAVGSVGTFTRDANGMPTACADNTGLTTITINGGKIGHDHQDTGMVDGSSRGWEGNPDGEGAFAFLNQLAWVNNTDVIIGDSLSAAEDKGPTIMGSVYGGGENGHNFQDGQVTVHKGTIGFEEGTWDCGNVYGAGCGTDTYWVDANGNDEQDAGEVHHNPMAGLVRGNTTVTINGGHVLRNVYGGGSMGSVGTDAVATSGKTTVTVNGGKIGTDDTEYGNVFGGPKGNLDDTEVIAHVRETQVNINDGDVNYCVYGGGEAGIVKEDTEVNFSGGSVNHSVYGGGCLADVLGNTRVEMTDGYVFNGIFGGGYSGSVGTFTRSTAAADVTVFGHTPHAGCIGRPMSCAANTGKCTVVVTGGQVGPIEAATEGMTRRDANGVLDPVEEGWIWGGGRGLVQDPAGHPDMHFTAYVNETDVTIGGDAFILESIIGGGEFGRVLGDTHVTIQDHCQIGVGYKQTDGDKPLRYPEEKFIDPSTQTITDADTLAMCSCFEYGRDDDGDGKPEFLSFDQYYDKYYDATTGKFPNDVPDEFKLGSTSRPSDGKTWIGLVFGGGSGYMPCEKSDSTGYGWVLSAGWVGGNTNVTITGGHILTNVYGANEYTNVEGKSTVKMSGGTIGVPRTLAQIKKNPLNGNLFGAGKGDPRTHFNQMTNVGSTEVEVTGGIIYGSVYGGGEDGHVLGDAVTTIKKGTGDAPVIGCSSIADLNGNVFGGGQGAATALTAGVIGGNVTLNIEGGFINGSVYGGGELASVGTHFAMVKIEDPNNPGQMIDNPDYGKMQEGADHGCIAVNLKCGSIRQNVYGGCMGSTDNAALGVSKDVTVELNKGVDDTAQGCAVKGSIFGCNNVNSSPEGTATVHVYKTQRAGKSRITNGGGVTDAKVAGVQTNGDFDLSTFDVKAVYGGGNMAAYVPKDEDGTTNVIIDGCDRTSIGHVYGGGNAASTPATNVEVNGTFEIGELFGGGNGKDSIVVDNVKQVNPGANVGYTDYHLVENNPEFATKDARVNGAAFAAYRYGTGKATVNIKGGTIHRVFGGSNTKGNVRKTALTMLEEVEENGDPVCPLHIDEAYGGGKSALMDAEAKLLMACIPGLKEIYGGAQAADVNDNVTLNITNGTFDRVFGGNNLSGTIRGAITVNIEETGCRPVIIGELYGGGNQAAYSIHGYQSDGTIKETGDTLYADPQVNVKSFTSIGTVYGGGYGAGAVMVGSPHVNINESKGTPGSYPTTGDFDGNGFKGKTIMVDGHEVTLPNHKSGSIGAINNVFGGGNAAKVMGNTYVNIGTDACEGVDIRGNVYGGGNNAQVTGNTNVVIGKKADRE